MLLYGLFTIIRSTKVNRTEIVRSVLRSRSHAPPASNLIMMYILNTRSPYHRILPCFLQIPVCLSHAPPCLQVPVLSDPGEADMTVDVNFGLLRSLVAGVEGATPHGPVGQGQFLREMGIGARLTALAEQPSVTEEQVGERTGSFFVYGRE